MSQSTILRCTLAGLFTLATALGAVGCTSVVIDERPGAGTGASRSTPPSSDLPNDSCMDPTCEDPGGGGPAIALRYAEFPPIGGGGGSSTSSSSGGGGGTDPDTLFLIFGSGAKLCTDPYAMPCGEWGVSIGIPPAYQKPGTYSLGPGTLLSSAHTRGPDEGGGNCSFGGGSFFDGTIEIESIDANQVVFNLAGTSTLLVTADGHYAATRCP